jgi:1-acyl-sn-glycerol-3-phosphate acyltransferase
MSVLWGLKVFAGVRMRVTGKVPDGAVLVASKHMSMWDTLAIYVVLGHPGIILKRALLYVPFFGWYLARSTAIAIDRAAGASALRAMAKGAAAVLAEHRAVVIFPEGTRQKPGAPPAYKPGVAGLYRQLDVPCVPVALDSGRYWQGFWKRPGTITLAFLEPVPPGLKRAAFMAILEERIETATADLLA